MGKQQYMNLVLEDEYLHAMKALADERDVTNLKEYMEVRIVARLRRCCNFFRPAAPGPCSCADAAS